MFKEDIFPFKHSDYSVNTDHSLHNNYLPLVNPADIDIQTSIPSYIQPPISSIPPFEVSLPNSSSSSLPSQHDYHDPSANSTDRRSTRVIQQPKKFESYVLSTTSHGLHDDASIPPDYVVSLNNVFTSPVEPSSYTQAKHDPRWINGMDAEIKSLEANNTWELVPLPKG